MATLHLFCGKIASGKSTLASEIASQPGNICLNEDDWLSVLYPNEVTSLEEFIHRSACLEAALRPHLIEILSAGLNVVLDFHANTKERRRWMKNIIAESGCDHELHFLDVSNDICRKRLKARNLAGDHAYQASDDELDQFTNYFNPPSEDEGFNVIVHGD